MKNSTVLDLKSIKAFAFLKNNYLLLLMCVFFILGLGFANFSDAAFLKKIGLFFTDYFFKNHFGIEFFRLFFLTLAIYSVSLLMQFIFGVSLMGIVTVPLISAFHGLLYGAVSSQLYENFALKGVAFNLTVLLPSFLIFSAASVLAACESLSFSILLARSTLPNSRPVNFFIDFKNYCGKFLIFLLIIIFASLVDAIFSKTFLGFFDFSL